VKEDRKGEREAAFIISEGERPQSNRNSLREDGIAEVPCAATTCGEGSDWEEMGEEKTRRSCAVGDETHQIKNKGSEL